MKLLQLADLHIGKRVNEVSMLEEQKHVLRQVVNIILENQIQGILIAGDVYDKSQPSTEAVELFDEFLTALAQLEIPVCIISGNHDSPERLSFGKHILKKNQLYITSVFQGHLEKITLEDQYGLCHIYMLPFVKPAVIRPFYQESIATYEEGIQVILGHEKLNTEERNVLIAHQFVMGGLTQPERTDSETISVGGLDQVSSNVFDSFDYVALGHLHAPQQVGRPEVRYGGSPLKYSFSEVHHQKSVTIIELFEKGRIELSQVPLTPIHDMREIKGPIEALLELGRANPESSEDYIRAILTDEEEVFDAIGRLRSVYPNIMAMETRNSKTQETEEEFQISMEKIAKKSLYELFSDFYQMQNNGEFTPWQQEFILNLIEEAGGNNL